jgi:endonuclease/exonuclease/phosphatase (EEP) superfamily protein YafD
MGRRPQGRRPQLRQEAQHQVQTTFPDKDKKLDYIWYKGLSASDYHVSTTNHSDHWIPQANVRP